MFNKKPVILDFIMKKMYNFMHSMLLGNIPIFKGEKLWYIYSKSVTFKSYK